MLTARAVVVYRMRWAILLTACGQTPLLLSVKQGFDRPDLVLDADTLPAAVRGYLATDTLRDLPGLPTFVPPARDADSDIEALCRDNSEGTATLGEAPCVVTQHYVCSGDGKIAIDWRYHDAECAGVRYNGEVAVEVQRLTSRLEAVHLRVGDQLIRRATYAQLVQAGTRYAMRLALIYVGDKRAVFGWPNGPEDFACFIGKDANGVFTGTYVENEYMALYVPANDQMRVHYRLQVPEESITAEGCTLEPLVAFCLFPNLCP